MSVTSLVCCSTAQTHQAQPGFEAASAKASAPTSGTLRLRDARGFLTESYRVNVSHGQAFKADSVLSLSYTDWSHFPARGRKKGHNILRARVRANRDVDQGKKDVQQVASLP